MVVFSGTNQGVFTSNGSAQVLQIRSDLDWMYVYNYTQIAAASASTGYQFYWQRGMAPGTGLEYKSNSGSTAVNIVALASGGFTLANNTISVPGPAIAITSITNATPPVVATGNTAGLFAGSTIVQLYNVVGAQQLGGLDFTVGTVVGSTSFTLAYMAGIAAATTGNYRVIPYDPYFYPPQRVISKIESSTLNGSNVAIVTLTVTHNFTVGQRVRFYIPQVTSSAFGMTQLNQVEATIVAIGAADADSTTNTITVNVDVSGFTAFAWPLTTDPAFTPAQVVPVGEYTAQANLSGVNPFQDAEINEGYIGILLGAGANGPAGQNADVIYWVAGKSFNQ